MGKRVNNPRLSDAVERRDLDGGVVLYLRDVETMLHVSADMAGIVDKLDGAHRLDELEVLVAGASRGLAYQELMQLLAGLWDRGMLDEAEALGEALFPNQRFRTVERARASVRLRKLLSWQAYSRRLGSALIALRGIGRLLSAGPSLVLAALLAFAGVVFQLGGVIRAPEKLLRYDGSWLHGIGLVYGALCLSLSIRGLVRAAALAGMGPGVPAAGLHITAGVVYFDVDCREVRYLARDRGFRFALSGVLAISTLAACFAWGHRLGGPTWWLHMAAVAQLAAFLDLCPFMATDGARLVELSASLSGQERRVGGYIGRKLLRGVLAGSDAEGTRFSIVATLWFVWFFAAVEVLGTAFVDEIVPLQIAVIRAGTPLEAWVCGLLLAYMLVLCIGTCGLMFWFAVKLVVQAFARETSDEPARATEESEFDEVERESLVERLSQLPMLAILDEETREGLMHGVQKQHFEAGAWLRRGATDTARIYWIASGEVQLLQPLPEGGHAFVEDLRAGEHFGEEGLLDAFYDCRAVSACEVLVVDLARVTEGVNGDVAGRAYVAALLERARFLEDGGPFATLDAMARFQLAAEVVECRLDAETLVVAQGAAAQSMFVIQRGRCSVWRGESCDGPREGLAELGPGDVFGELGLLHQRERSANVSCIDACVLLEVSAETLRKVLDRSIHVGSAFESLAASRAEARL